MHHMQYTLIAETRHIVFMKIIKALGLLKRIGPAKGGHWKVIE